LKGAPNHYGLIAFVDGGRFMADITDAEQGQIDSANKVRMAFRTGELRRQMRILALIPESRSPLTERKKSPPHRGGL
jgi:uncharacterized OB-fold protein